MFRSLFIAAVAASAATSALAQNGTDGTPATPAPPAEFPTPPGAPDPYVTAANLAPCPEDEVLVQAYWQDFTANPPALAIVCDEEDDVTGFVPLIGALSPGGAAAVFGGLALVAGAGAGGGDGATNNTQ